MQIKIPKSIFPVTRLIVETPSGVIANMEGDSTFQVANVELPEGVTEDEVSARVEYLDNSRKVITRDVVKEAVAKPVEFRQLRSASEAIVKPTPSVVTPVVTPPTDLDLVVDIGEVIAVDDNKSAQKIVSQIKAEISKSNK